VNSQQLVVILVLTSTICLCGCEGNKQAITSQRQANWSDADTSALSAARPEPMPGIRPETHFAAGQLFEQQGAINKAIARYQETVAGDPHHVAAWNRLGILHARHGRHQEAERALLRAVELQPDSALLRNNLGFEYVLQKRWVDAEAEFRNALTLKPDFDRARINLGMALAKQERYAEALTEFAHVVPEPDAYYNLGLIMRSDYRYRDAAGAFQRVLAIDPQFVAARQQLEQIETQLALSNELEPSLNSDDWTDLAEALTGTVADQAPTEEPTAGDEGEAAEATPLTSPDTQNVPAAAAPPPHAGQPDMTDNPPPLQNRVEEELPPAIPADEAGADEPEPMMAEPEYVLQEPDLGLCDHPLCGVLSLGGELCFDALIEPGGELIPWQEPL